MAGKRSDRMKHRLRLLACLLVIAGNCESIVLGQTVEPLPGLAVYDAKDRWVGNAISLFQESERRFDGLVVALAVQGIPLTIRITDKGFLNPSHTRLFSESDNCLPPFFFEKFDIHDPEGGRVQGLLPKTALGTPGITLYIPDPDISIPHMFEKRSTLIFLGDDPVGSCHLIPQPPLIVGIPAKALVDLSTEFTPPFTFTTVESPDMDALLQKIETLKGLVAGLQTNKEIETLKGLVAELQDNQEIEALKTLVAGLHDKNAQLLKKITSLNKTLGNHQHSYLTGKNKRHNKVIAHTGTAKGSIPTRNDQR